MTKAKKAAMKEIAWYNPPDSISAAMLVCSEYGFMPDGHGQGFGVEDWDMYLRVGDRLLVVEFETSQEGNKAFFRNEPEDDDVAEEDEENETYLCGTPQQLRKFVSKLLTKGKK